MAKAKEKSGLRLAVAGTKIELSVLFKADGGARSGNLAKSTAGGSGFRFKRICPEHLSPVKQRNVCEAAGHDVDLKTVLSGYDLGGGEMAYLSKEQVTALKPQGDDTIEVLYLVEADEYGWGFVPEIARLTGNVQAMVPNLTTSQKEAQAKLWAALLSLLHGKVAVARVMDGGSFFHAVLVPSPTGCVLAHELYLPEDVYEVPVVDVVELPPAHVEVLQKKGDELTRAFSQMDVATDPYREARYEAVAAASRGEVPKVEKPAAPKKVEVDIMALI